MKGINDDVVFVVIVACCCLLLFVVVYCCLLLLLKNTDRKDRIQCKICDQNFVGTEIRYVIFCSKK